VNRTHPPLLAALLLLLAFAALAAPPVLAEEAAAPAVAAPAAECGPAAAPLADAAGADELFSTPREEPEPPSLGDPEEPLFAGVPCNQRFCGPKEFCCNFSCSICASVFGGACTQQVCPVRP
jgi:hypothetical protein